LKNVFIVRYNKGVLEMAGNAAMGNLADEWTQGNAKVQIYDGAYAGKTSDEIQQVLNKVFRTCWMCVDAARAAGKDI